MSILVEQGMSTKDAAKVCQLGRVDLALQAHKNISSKGIVVNVLQAVESQDYVLFIQAYKAVDDTVAQLLLTALEESAAQSWKIFDPRYLGVFAKRDVALKLLQGWSMLSSARLSLAMKTTLESVIGS
jgi:hypothetical protein